MKTNPKIGDTVSDNSGTAIIKRVNKPKINTPFYGVETHLIDILRDNGKKAMNMPYSTFNK